MNAAKALRSIREARGATLREYADAMGIDEAHLSRLERGLVKTVTVGLAFRIKEVYGIPVEAWAGDSKLPDEDLARAVSEDEPPEDLPERGAA